jgi:2-methylisocitrate lyase-like PEP mutase family enzyme
LPDADWAVPRDAVLQHIASIVAAVPDIPVNADFESGYAHQPEGVAENVRLCVATGVAGLSIEDATGNSKQPLYDFPLAVERIKAARAAIDASGADVLLIARAECYLVDHPEPLREAIRRLTAYAEAGADVLYAPGSTSRADVEAIVNAVRPKPVNILLTSSTGLSLAELADLGVRRVSVGSALARAAWTGFIHAARAIANESSMAGLDNTVTFGELNGFFHKDHIERQ